MDRPVTLRAVLFDLDGTLIDSKEAWFLTMEAACRHFGFPPLPREAFETVWHDGAPDEETAHSFPGMDKETLFGFISSQLPLHTKNVAAMPGAGEALEVIRAAGWATAVVTNSPTSCALALLKTLALRVDEVIGGMDVERAKPAPDMVLLALQRLGAAPDEAILVGDSAADREAAGTAGVRFAGYGMEGEITFSSYHQLLQYLGLKHR